MISVMVKSVFCIVGAYLFRSHTNGFCQHIAGAGLCREQFRFDFAKSEFNQFKIRRIRR